LGALGMLSGAITVWSGLIAKGTGQRGPV